MAESVDYNISTISLDPREIDGIAKALIAHANSVADTLEAIGNVAFELRLGWAGETAKEAKAFQDRWNAVMQQLFGSKKHPDSGVLNVMAGAVKKVAIGYSNTEMELEKAFRDFSNSLAGGGSGETPDKAPNDVPTGLDPRDSAILEDFPN
ncbi:WXG100 family type VII secretion target [Streptomyces tendae]